MCSPQLDSQEGLVYFLILFRKWRCGLKGVYACVGGGGMGVFLCLVSVDGSPLMEPINHELLKVVCVETRPL